MTLVVYEGNKFYADDVSLGDHRSSNLQFRHNTQKIHTAGPGKTGEIAVAICGPFPWERNLKRVIKTICRIAYYADQGAMQSVDLALPKDSEQQEFLDISNLRRSTTYMFATKRMLYRMDKDGLFTLNRDMEYSHGSGRTYYGMCRKAGMSVEAAFAETAKYEKTVGKLFMTVDVSDLTDLVDNVVKYMRTGEKKNLALADDVERYAIKARKEMDQ